MTDGLSEGGFLPDPWDPRWTEAAGGVNGALELTPEEENLREAFNRATDVNRGLLERFDPDATDADIDLLVHRDDIVMLAPDRSIDTPANPELLEAFHTNMLCTLGLQYESLGDGDPTRIFQQGSTDDSVRQIRSVMSPDGRPYHLYTRLEADEHGGRVARLTLLSPALGAQKARKMAESDGFADLVHDLGVDENLAKIAEYESADDRRELLAQLESLCRAPTVEPDIAPLGPARDQLVKAILAGARVTADFPSTAESGELERAATEYEAILEQLKQRFGLDEAASRKLVQAERQRRVEGLQTGLARRLSAKKIGDYAMQAFAAMMTAGIEVIPDAKLEQVAQVDALIPKLVVGVMGFGAVLTVMRDRKKALDKVARQLKNFEDELSPAADDDLPAQLTSELRLTRAHTKRIKHG